MCLLDKPFDEKNLEDIDIGVLFFFFGWGPRNDIFLMASDISIVGREETPIKDCYVVFCTSEIV